MNSRLIIIFIMSIFFNFIKFDIKAQSIGDFYQGGVVFYTDSSGGGLIVDVADLSNPSPMGNTFLDSLLSRWGNYSELVAGTSADSIGAGQLNTQNFIIHYPTGNYAAHQCVNSIRGGYTDWFLPSKNELLEIFIYKSLIDSVSVLNGGHLFDDFATLYPYWSSSQTPSVNDLRNAYAVYSSGFSLLRGKVLEYKVRAVRAFSTSVDIENNTSISSKKVIKIVDLTGNRVSVTTNSILIFIYNDGSVEKKFIVE